jgi:hypothetical protein
MEVSGKIHAQQFNNREKSLRYFLVGGYVIPDQLWTEVVKRKKIPPCLCRKSNSGRPARSFVNTLALNNRISSGFCCCKNGKNYLISLSLCVLLQ